jgi:hypothetical protein
MLKCRSSLLFDRSSVWTLIHGVHSIWRIAVSGTKGGKSGQAVPHVLLNHTNEEDPGTIAMTSTPPQLVKLSSHLDIDDFGVLLAVRILYAQIAEY